MTLLHKFVENKDDDQLYITFLEGHISLDNFEVTYGKKHSNCIETVAEYSH